MTNKDNKDEFEVIDMTKGNLSQKLFNRLSVFDKLTLLDYVSSSKHEIVINEELRWIIQY